MQRLSQSFKHALRGIRLVFRSERNFRLHIAVAALVLVFSFLVPLSRSEQAALVVLITLVLVLEMTNTAFEYFLDLMKPRLHEYVQHIKDIMAGGVLIAATSAVVGGFIIFGHHFIDFFK